MATTTITLSSGTSLSSGDNSGYRLAAGTTAYTLTGTYKYTSPSYPIKVTAVAVPWFGYSAASSNITVSGTITVKIGSATFTGTLSSTTLKTNTNVTGTVTCSGSVVLATNTSYSVSVTCSGSNLLKTGTRFATNGKSLTGTYAANTYTITYKPGSYSSGSNYTQTKTAGTALTLRAATYSRTGYTQSGWSTASAGTSKAYNLSASYTANAVATFYPYWTANTYSISYSLGGGSFANGTNYTAISGNYTRKYNPTSIAYDCSDVTPLDSSHPAADFFNLDRPVRTGYTFSSWTISNMTANVAQYYINSAWSTFTSTSATGITAGALRRLRSSSGTVTFTAVWTANKYTITFNRNGGPANGSSSATATYAAAMPSATMPTRAGYTFDGYYDAASGGTQYYTAAGASARTWNKTAATTLYAHWTKNNYTLTFNANGGECSETSRTVAYNTNIDDLPIPTRSGYTFVGWGHDFNGSQQAIWGRDMMYTNRISVHLSAYMDDWSLYSSTPMRIISCTEGGGWNIEPSNDCIAFACYDAGASSYKSAISAVQWASLEAGWHVFDIIFDGTNVKGYLDGELIITSAAYTGGIGYHATNGIFVGCEASSSETTGVAPYFTGSIANITIRNNTTLLSTDTYTSITSPAGNLTLKAYWVRANHINVFYNNTWNDVPINIYHNGEWQPSIIQTYYNGAWKET